MVRNPPTCKYPGCQKGVFSSNQALHAHSLRHRDKQQPTPQWKCPFSDDCPTWQPKCKLKGVNSLPKINSLLSHIAKEHTKGPKAFQCHLCDNKFHTEPNLAEHIQKHHTERHRERQERQRFQCQFEGCDKDYVDARGLRRHIETSHMYSDCPICPEKFEEMTLLVHHMKSEHSVEHQTQVYEIPLACLTQIIPAFSGPTIKRRLAALQSDTDEDEDKDEDTCVFEALDEYSPSIISVFEQRNREFVNHISSVYEGFRATFTLPSQSLLCPGPPKSDHGCPYGVRLTTSTAILEATASTLRWHGYCYFCGNDYISVHRYQIRHSEDGVRLCGALNTCNEPALSGLRCCEKHHMRRRVYDRANKTRRKLLDNARVGIGSDIVTAELLTRHLEEKGIKAVGNCGRAMRRLYNAVKAGARAFYIDFEFTRYFPVEVAIRDTAGNLLLSTTINLECTIADLHYVGELTDKEVGTLWRIYGPPSDLPTPGMTPTEIMGFLRRNQMSIDTYVPEWSSSRCDYKWLCWLAEMSGDTDIVPSYENSILVCSAWRSAFPGFFSFKLSDLYLFLCPGDIDRTIKESHTAGFDTEMLYLSTQFFFEHAFGDREVEREVETIVD